MNFVIVKFFASYFLNSYVDLLMNYCMQTKNRREEGMRIEDKNNVLKKVLNTLIWLNSLVLQLNCNIE